MFKHAPYGYRNLPPASFCDEHFWLLMELSGIRSDKIMLSLREYLVEGFSRKEICDRNGISSSYFAICLNKISYINNISAGLSKYYNDD